MPISYLLNVPQSPEDWEIFAFTNRDQNTQIRQAIKKQHNINLTEYQLYPLDLSSKENIQYWLIQNGQAHIDFNSVLGLESQDLYSVDFSDKNQLSAWIYLNWQELQSASSALQI